MDDERDMSYQMRSEFSRLKHADVEQGKRIAQLIAENENLRSCVDGWHGNWKQQVAEVARLREAWSDDHDKLTGTIEELKENLRHPPPCNCDLTCEDFVTLNRLLCYLRDKHGCEAAWKETIAALARTIRVGEMKEDGHDPHR